MTKEYKICIKRVARIQWRREARITRLWSNKFVVSCQSRRQTNRLSPSLHAREDKLQREGVGIILRTSRECEGCFHMQNEKNPLAASLSAFMTTARARNFGISFNLAKKEAPSQYSRVLSALISAVGDKTRLVDR